MLLNYLLGTILMNTAMFNVVFFHLYVYYHELAYLFIQLCEVSELLFIISVNYVYQTFM